MPDASRRPPQVTMAAWTIVAGSVVVVLSGFETMAALHSLEMRETIERFLAQPPGSDLGLGVDGVRGVVHAATLVASACAAAAAILGYQVLQRNRAARIGLTALAVPLFVAGLITGAFFSSLVAAASAMLWVSPAREWFAGTWRPVPREAPPSPADRRGKPGDLPPLPGPPQAGPPQAGPPQAGPPLATGPRPTVGYGTPEADAAPPPGAPLSLSPQGPYQHAYQGGHRLGYRPVLPPARPAAVTLACVVTWIFAGLTTVLSFAMVAMMLVDRRLLLDQMNRQSSDLVDQGISEDTLATTIVIVGTIMLIWSVLAVVLAGFAFAGRSWARLALLVCAATAGVAMLISVAAGQVVVLVPLAAAAATAFALNRPEVKTWFAQVRQLRGGMAP
ncbi:MAG: hypothetical protein QM714_14755 [Nocardioides sp.]|uniref:hypothetical protein n=1 Tax=Nocardioides sp. TaxID=35761 RepID=UPI0039E54272